MTPLEIKTELRAFQAEVGPKAEVFANIEIRYSHVISVSVYPEGICKGSSCRVEGDDWREAIDKIKVAWAESAERFHRRMVSELALEIIRITSELGTCTDASLRGDKWSRADVERYGAEACVKANEMASNGPFSIQPASIANEIPVYWCP
jgi:hypothetical protein